MSKIDWPNGPAGLSVELLEIEGAEFAVFRWCVGVSDADRAYDQLTEAERSVLEHLIAGSSNADIARARSTSVRTVANQVASLLKKLGATSRFELIRRYAPSHADPRST